MLKLDMWLVMGKHHNTTFIPCEIPHTLLTYMALPQRRTKMDIDDDVGRQTCRQIKMETYEDEEGRILGLSKAAALLQLMTTPE